MHLPFSKATKGLTGTTIVLDIDGTLVPEEGEKISSETMAAIELLKKNNGVFLCSNSRNKERNERIATLLELPLIQSRHRKPIPHLFKELGPHSSPIVVIGDKFLTDGLLAFFGKATFIKVQRVTSGRETLLQKMTHLIDDIVHFFVRHFVWIAIFLFLATTVPVYHVHLKNGIDMSWIYGINQFFAEGVAWGTDVIYSFGPLGFLYYPIDHGSNLTIALTAQLLVYTLFAASLIFLAYKKYFGALSTVIALALWHLTLPRTEYGVSFYHFSVFAFLFFIACAYLAKKWKIFFSAALVLAAVFFFIKFSMAALALGTLILFSVAHFFIDRKKARYMRITTGIFLPLLIISIYLIHNPSFEGLWLYVRGGLEISSGYSAAMGVVGPRADLVLALVVGLFYLALVLILYKKNRQLFWLAAVFCWPIFVIFKQSFVRHDVLHQDFFFAAVLFIFGLFLLFAQSLKKNATSLLFGFTAICFFLSAPVLFSQKLPPPTAEVTYLTEDILPPSFLREIGSEPVTIFPWETLIGAVNEINYVPLPVFQTHMAYTPYLDRRNAEFLEKKGPPFMIFEWKGLDERNPLLDVPKTFVSMYAWYDAAQKEGSMLLLKRRGTPRTLGELTVPLQLELTPVGKFAEFAISVPPLFAEVVHGDGAVKKVRLVPENMSTPTLFDQLPYDLESARDLFSDTSRFTKKASIKLRSGERYFRTTSH